VLAGTELPFRQSKVRESFRSILVDEGLTDFLPIIFRQRDGLFSKGSFLFSGLFYTYSSLCTRPFHSQALFSHRTLNTLDCKGICPTRSDRYAATSRIHALLFCDSTVTSCQVESPRACTTMLACVPSVVNEFYICNTRNSLHTPASVTKPGTFAGRLATISYGIF
jgi:hypothetical protein